MVRSMAKFSSGDADSILSFMAISGTNEEVLKQLSFYTGKTETFDLGFEELSAVVKHLSAFGVPDDHLKVDLTIARGLDYYTGTVYETTMLDYPEIGSICSGGRYDDLAGYYTDRKLPGVGISIGLTRLFYVLENYGLLNDDVPSSPADVLVIPMTDEPDAAVAAATALRAEGIRTQIYGEKKKFKAKITYASKLGIPYAVFIGEDEIKNGVISVKDLSTGEQVTETFDLAAKRIQEGLSLLSGKAVIKEK